MIGIAIEVNTVCQKCGQPVPINAMEMSILCPHCSTPNELTLDDWQTIVGDAIKVAPTYEEDEGNRTTVLGRRKYTLMYGRQLPRFDSKVKIDMDAAITDPDGKIFDPETGTAHFIREAAPDFKKAFPGLSHLVCEDVDQWTTKPEGAIVGQSDAGAKPEAITCPKCGGSFETIGEQRDVYCGYCGAACFLPDEVWQRLHPVKKVRRWFLWYDESQVPLAWESSVADAVADADGNLYMVTQLETFGDACPVSLDPQYRMRWRRNDIKLSDSHARLSLSTDGRLYTWSQQKNSLRVLSAADGSDIDKLGGNGGRQPAGEPFSLKKSCSLASDTDGTLLAFCNRDKDDNEGGSYYELLRYDRDGSVISTWPEQEQPGFFGRLARSISGKSGPLYTSDLGDMPCKFKDWNTEISVGLDGSYYLQRYDNVVKYTREGEKVYNVKREDSIRGRICGDAQGRALLIERPMINDASGARICRISPDGAESSVLVGSILEGGTMGYEDHLALSANGTIFAVGYGGRLRVFSADGAVLHISADSKKADEREIKEAKERQD